MKVLVGINFPNLSKIVLSDYTFPDWSHVVGELITASIIGGIHHIFLLTQNNDTIMLEFNSRCILMGNLRSYKDSSLQKGTYNNY